MNNVIKNPLDFEKELIMQEVRLAELGERLNAGDEEVRKDYAELEEKVSKLRKETYKGLSVYQKVQISRHQNRPLTLDYIDLIFTDFVELHGDRCFRDDPAIVGGLAKLSGKSVIVIGHQRGKDMQERLKRNFGMAEPDGYRKSQRLFFMAEKFGLPVINFIDTAGAYPGIEAEERGQAQAIAKNLEILSTLKTRIISVVIGEGGSGGALALGVADRVLMLQNACYSVISPEGCASILWGKDGEEVSLDRIKQSAELLKLTSQDLKKFGIIDEIVEEPLGGAHRNYKEMAEVLKSSLFRNLKELEKLSIEELTKKRYLKFRNIGDFSI
ncbi:MAG: acetyl-CoA carboxylase carboxyltransferase subunit alpha [Bdellovibrionota bacterium]